MAELYEIVSKAEAVIGIGLMGTGVYLSTCANSTCDNILIGAGVLIVADGLIRQDGKGAIPEFVCKQTVNLYNKYFKKDRD